MEKIKSVYRYVRKKYKKILFLATVNWWKTIFFNFKKFSFKVALKLPVFFYGPVKFTNLTGDIKIEGPISMGMIGFGQTYEYNTATSGISEINIQGELVFKGYFQFGKDYFLIVNDNAKCILGNMSSLGSRGKLICTKHIVFGNYVRIGSECQVIDSNFHDMINLKTGELYPKQSPIFIGDYNYIASRVTLMKGTKTPNYCSVGINSLCNKDYSNLGSYVLIGGVPAKLLKEQISRDWEREQKQFEQFVIINKKYN